MADLIERQIAIDAIKTWGLIDGLSEGQAIEILSDENKVPSAEPEAISKWKKEFREYVDSLDIARDDWKGIIEYIDELPSVQPDTTTHDSIPAETGKNDSDRTSGDCISRQQAIEAVVGCTNCGTEDVLRAYVVKHSLENGWTGGIVDALDAIKELSSAQPNLQPTCNQLATDCISRRQAIDKFIDALEEIFSDIREKHVDDSVCGLCEYDGAYIGQSGDWCNECPGFDRDDCFKLSDKTRKKWTDEIIKAFPSVQPDIIRCKDCAYCDSDVVDAPYGMTKKVRWCDRLYAGANENLIVEPDDFCSWAERRQDG